MNTEVLVALTNRGIVNRAEREALSSPPEIEETEQGIRASFATGHTVVLNEGSPLAESTCTCGSTALCRHRVGMVLAYQRHGERDDVHPDWSPGDFTDEQLTKHYGVRALNTARRARDAGYTATIHRVAKGNTETRVELPRATVRFLVARDLHHAHTSATDQQAATTIILAVWAVRLADHTGADTVHLESETTGEQPESLRDDAARDVVDTVLRAGASNVTGSLRAGLRRSLSDIAATQQTWVIEATADLLDVVDARGDRHSRFSRRRLTELLVEVYNRAALAGSATSLIARTASGVDVAPETPIRRTSFTGLGARRASAGEPPGVDIFLYDRSARSVCVWHHDVGDSGARHGTNSRTYLIASGSMIATSAVRLAGNRVRFSRAGPRSMSLLPPDPQVWATLGDIHMSDYSHLRQTLSTRLPSFARARNAVESLFVLEIDHVADVEYSPGDQTLRAWVHDSHGHRARIEAEYRADNASALDMTANALRQELTAVSGMVRLHGGELVVDPYAMVAGGSIVVPQLAADAPPASAKPPAATEPDGIAPFIEGVLDLLGELAERGLEHPRNEASNHLDSIAQEASNHGMRETGEALTSLARAITGEMVHQRCDSWVHAATRLLVASENA